MGLNGNSDDITSNQNAAASPTGGIAELVQQMEKTILQRRSRLHLGHTGCWALLRDAVLTRNTQAGMGEKPREGNKPGHLGGQRQKTKRPNTKNEIYWNHTAEDLLGKKTLEFN